MFPPPLFCGGHAPRRTAQRRSNWGFFKRHFWGDYARHSHFADGGYAGPKLRSALDKIGDWTLEIVKRSDAAKGFEMLPRRWVVERAFAWLGRCRRLAKDWEKTIASAEAWITIAHIRRVTRHLARHCQTS